MLFFCVVTTVINNNLCATRKKIVIAYRDIMLMSYSSVLCRYQSTYVSSCCEFALRIAASALYSMIIPTHTYKQTWECLIYTLKWLWYLQGDNKFFKIAYSWANKRQEPSLAKQSMYMGNQDSFPAIHSEKLQGALQ